MKNKLSLISLFITFIGSFSLSFLVILSDILYPDISEFVEMPSYYKILIFISLIMIIGGIILSAKFRNKDNTKTVELYIEVTGIVLGFIFMSMALLRTESNIKSIIEIGIILFFSGIFSLISTLIGLVRKNQNK